MKKHTHSHIYIYIYVEGERERELIGSLQNSRLWLAKEELLASEWLHAHQRSAALLGPHPHLGRTSGVFKN